MFSIYSPSEKPVAKEALRAELEKRGWKVFFAFCSYVTIGGAAFYHEIESIAASRGLLEQESLLIACEASDKNLQAFLQATENNDINALAEMLESHKISFCCISWSSFDCNKDYGIDFLDVNGINLPERWINTLKQAQFEYFSPDSYGDFYQDVAQAIGDLVGGMLEDPQTGEIEFKTARL